MTFRALPEDCPCPWVRHHDGNPHIEWPDPSCPHHGRRTPAPVVVPFRRPTRRRPRGGTR